MAEFELRERGYFWWTDEAPTDGSVAPDTGAFGELRISRKGEIELDLDGMLPTKSGPFDNIFFKDRSIDRMISGSLKKVNLHVLLVEVRRGAASASNGFLSYQSLHAGICLVGKHRFATVPEIPDIARVHIPLSGFEEWLWLKDIKIKSNEKSCSATYKQQNDVVYQIKGGVLKLAYDIFGPFGPSGYSHQVRETQMRQVATMIYEPSDKITLEDTRKYFNSFQELLITLTNSDQSLDWPEIEQDGALTKTRFYFYRLRSKESELKLFDCWFLYPRIKKQFGILYDKWTELSEKYGPGIYLLLGHRKGMILYSEHQFISMIWGLESLHRSLTADQPRVELSAKAQRIIEQVGPSKDRRWLKQKLEYASEPSLAERLVDILGALPIQFPPGELRNFCDACAAHRNDISHFGGKRGDLDRNEFYRELMIRSEALNTLYQARVLQLIGISNADLKWLFEQSSKSFRLKYALWLSRLANKEDGFDGEQLVQWLPKPKA